MEEINLSEVYSYFKTKILWILLAVVLIIVLGNVFTLLTRTPLYQSNTTIVLVGENKSGYSQTESQRNQNLSKLNYKNESKQIIKSRKVLNQVIENLDLKLTTTDLAQSITTSSVEDTEIIQITVNNPKAKDAKKITDELAEVFAKEIKDIYHLENVEIIDKAEIAKTPYNVNYLKDNVIYLAVGLVLSFGVVFVMYYFDTSIKSSDIVEEKLGLTVIGIVPKEERE